MTLADALIASAKLHAQRVGLDPALVCAVCEQESNWNPWAIRYEPGFYDRYIVPLPLNSATEAHARAFSWGLMQVMGQVARERGYTGDLAMLCDPDTALSIGCDVLKAKLAIAGGNVHQGLQRWNGGANLSYADQVMARMGKYQ